MKYLKQLGIILLVTCIGELIRYFVPLPIPGSIYGLVLMFVLLCTHVIKLDDVRAGAGFLIEIMPVMFIPAAVGLMDSWSDVQPILIPMLVIPIVTTAIVMAVTGITAQKIIEKGKKRHE
jgi:holin-like protein